MARPNVPISPSNLKNYSFNRSGMVNANGQSLYDFQAYAAAGQTQLLFFQVPKGQSSKTFADTNATLAGSLPQPQRMLVRGISVVFFPGSAVNASGAIGTSGLNWQDTWQVFKSGWLEFFIGSTPYIDEAPIGRFPPQFRLAGAAAMADATTAASALHSQIDYATFAGPAYKFTPVMLEPNQNFNVSLNWPAAVALPSAVAGRIGVILDGDLYRLAQ